jgi:transcriptional regulator with XRE-family HTH domain
MTTAELLEALKHNHEARAILKGLYGNGKNDKRDAEIAQRVWAGETQSSLAMEYGLSVNRVSQIMATRKNPNPNAGRPQRNAERDRLILERANAKKTRAEIAKEFGLSVIRVNQIVSASRSFGKQQAKTWEDRAADARTKYAMGQTLTPNEVSMVLITSYSDVCEDIIADMREGKMHDYLEPKYGNVIDDLPTNMNHYLDVWAKLCPREPYIRSLMYQTDG